MLNTSLHPKLSISAQLTLCALLPLVGLTAACQPKASGAHIKPTTVQPEAHVVPPTSEKQEGILEMARLPGGKAFQPTTLLLKGGGELLLSYRPMPKYVHLVGEAVVVTGESYSPDGQAVGGDHFKVSAITPKDPTSTHSTRDSFPPTPLFAKHDQAASLHGRWVHVQGSFDKAANQDEHASWVTLIFKMKADAPIKIRIYQSEFDRKWKALQGKPITIVCELSLFYQNKTPYEREALTPKSLKEMAKTQEKGQIIFQTPMRVCEGHRNGCGPIKLKE